MAQLGTLVLGASNAIADLIAEAERYARLRHPILILGERGTGKSVLARHVHALSERPGAFVKTSVAGIPEHLEIAQLAGHRRGAFTGAVADSKGLIESAQQGTFFLDELGLASTRIQELLLHFLEDGSIRRVGDVRDVRLDVRFIGATNADLEMLAESGAFRRDLRDRFGHFVLRVPPLRERTEDILELAEHFLAVEATMLTQDAPVLSEEVRGCFMVAPWLGNVRELQSVCRYAIVHASAGGEVQLAHLPPDFLAPLGSTIRVRTGRPSAKERAIEAVDRAGGNKAKAARILGISRTHLYRMLGMYSWMMALVSQV